MRSSVLCLLLLSGCHPVMEAVAPEGDGDKMAKCRKESRAVMYGEGGNTAKALAAYEACLRREGLK